MNSNIFKKVKIFLKDYYRFQHPEAALRYAPVVKEIKKRQLESSKIIEIGSGSTGITPYLKKEIDGVDIDFKGPKTDLVKKIKAHAYALPFKKNSYDVSISVDVLEHVGPSVREKSIYEMLRVTKKLAIVVVPCGEDSESQDKDLQKTWNKVFKSKNQFLNEHVENGLPKIDELLVYIDKTLRKLGKKARIYSYPNLNLTVRKLLMKTWITKRKAIYYLYLKGYLPFIPVLKYANFGKTYRRVFVIEFDIN